MLLVYPWVRFDRTYFTEIENWKYYNKIIFKCVNSIVKTIFSGKNCGTVKFMDPMIEKLLKNWFKGVGKVSVYCHAILSQQS